MGFGIGLVNTFAREVAGWPGGVVALAAAVHQRLDRHHTLGGLWLCLWRGRWRFWGVPMILAGLL